MAATQHHQGLRLKNFVEKSNKTVTQIVSELGISRATLYNWFETEELLMSKIRPVLKAISIEETEFNTIVSVVNDDSEKYGAKAVIDLLRKEIETLKNELAAKDELIAKLKAKKK